MSNRNELLFLLCQDRLVGDLVEHVSQQLSLEQEKHAVALYGITGKAHDGFVIALSESGFPSQFLEELKVHALVNDFVRWSASRPRNQSEKAADEKKSQEAPLCPEGYTLASIAHPLVPGDETTYWVALASCDLCPLGILIYEPVSVPSSGSSMDGAPTPPRESVYTQNPTRSSASAPGHRVIYLAPDEVVGLMAQVVPWLSALFPYCSPLHMPQFVHFLEQIADLWLEQREGQNE